MPRHNGNTYRPSKTERRRKRAAASRNAEAQREKQRREQARHTRHQEDSNE